jgi:hypothetical protein
MRIRLLPHRSLLKTGPVDHADWNYRPLLGWIMGRRFALFRKLLPRGKAMHMDEELINLGLDSMNALNVMFDLEAAFEVSFPDSTSFCSSASIFCRGDNITS